MSSPLNSDISAYAQAVNGLGSASDAEFPDATLRALSARDKVAHTLSQGAPSIALSDMTQLTDADRQLASSAAKIKATVKAETLTSWRNSINPNSSAWWWKLDEMAAANKADKILTIISVLILTVSVYLFVDTFNLLRSIGENPVGTAGTLIQAILAVIAASAFTEAGRKRLIDTFSFFGVKNRKFQGIGRAGLATVVLVLTLTIRMCVPAAAAYYFEWQGNKFLAEGLVQRAIPAYQQASALQPYSISIHLALAKAAEKANDYSKAIAEYKSTIVLYERSGERPNDAYYEAKNNLARLLTQHEKNYSATLRLLDKPEVMIERLSPGNRQLFTYFFSTYRGWAQLEANNFSQAEGELNTALQQREDGAAAHYLLGRIFEARKQTDKARDKYSRFLTILQSDAQQTEQVPAEWISYAQEKTLSDGAK
jgi:hypothetical protein